MYVYIPPANSKFYAKYDCNIFNDLKNQSSYYKNIGKVAIVGDFNARTAGRNDYIESDSTSEVVSNCDLFTYIPDAIMPDRTNLDPVVNEYGLKLISMCKSSGLRIQNGRWEKTHDFTFAGSRGRSVVDYLISQEGVLIEEFRIADFTTFSDHTPLEFFSECYEHFRSLSGTCEENDECNFVLNDNIVYDELESEIYNDEILEAIKKLKTNKAHGEDCLLNEFFIEFKEYILPYLYDMFNIILNSGHFPDDWSKAVIIPVFKKGDRSNPSDYRGISLISCLCKLFT